MGGIWANPDPASHGIAGFRVSGGETSLGEATEAPYRKMEEARHSAEGQLRGGLFVSK